MASTIYDKSELFEEKVRPLMKQITDICRTNSIPFFFSAAVKNQVDDTKYENIALTALPMGIYLKNDQLVEHIKVSSGFIASPPDVIPDLEL